MGHLDAKFSSWESHCRCLLRGPSTHADIEILGSGCSVVRLKNIFFLWKNAFLRHGNPLVSGPNFH